MSQDGRIAATEADHRHLRQVGIRTRRATCGTPTPGTPLWMQRVRREPPLPRASPLDRIGNSFTYPQYGGGVVLDGGMLSLSKLGRIPLRLHRPLEGTPKTVSIVREADGWYACISCAEVPVELLPPTGREAGIDVGLKVFLVTASGDVNYPRLKAGACS